MNDMQKHRFERGERVHDYVPNINPPFAKDSKGAKVIAEVNQLVERIRALDADLLTNKRAARTGTSGKAEAKTELNAMLRAIRRTAKAIGLDNPDLKNKFRLPTGALSQQALVSTARSFQAEATPYKAQFIEYGMKADFLDALAAKIEEFDAHANEQHNSLSTRAANLAAIADVLKQLDAAIRRLDAILRNQFADDPATLAAWTVVSDVERPQHKRKNGKAPTPTTPK